AEFGETFDDAEVVALFGGERGGGGRGRDGRGWLGWLGWLSWLRGGGLAARGQAEGGRAEDEGGRGRARQQAASAHLFLRARTRTVSLVARARTGRCSLAAGTFLRIVGVVGGRDRVGRDLEIGVTLVGPGFGGGGVRGVHVSWCGHIGRLPGRAVLTRSRGPLTADEGAEGFAVGHVDLGVGTVEVAFDGADGQHEPLGDLPVRQARGHQVRDLALPCGQRQRLGGRAQGRSARAAAGRGQTAGGGGGRGEATALARALVGGGGLGGGVGGRQQGADPLELRGRGIEGGAVVRREGAGVGGLHGDQPARHARGQLGQPVGHRGLAETGGHVQGGGLDGVLVGGGRGVGG